MAVYGQLKAVINFIIEKAYARGSMRVTTQVPGSQAMGKGDPSGSEQEAALRAHGRKRTARDTQSPRTFGAAERARHLLRHVDQT